MDPLAIRRQSATPSSQPSIRGGAAPRIGKLVDISLCIGCKACEVACKEWNDLPVDDTHNFGSYQSHKTLTPNTWDLMLFNEVEINGSLQWLIRKVSCLHCDGPGCLFACPAPGAIVQYTNGIVDFNQDKCIGCQSCLAGCPFDIPKYDGKTAKVYKCTLCLDRVGAALEPACVKSCPTAAIKFGTRERILAEADASVARLKARGFAQASVYNPGGVGGTTMIYVVPHGDHLGDYQLPEDPQARRGGLAALGPWKWTGAGLVWAGVAGLALHFIRFRGARIEQLKQRERELEEEQS